MKIRAERLIEAFDKAGLNKLLYDMQLATSASSDLSQIITPLQSQLTQMMEAAIQQFNGEDDSYVGEAKGTAITVYDLLEFCTKKMTGFANGIHMAIEGNKQQALENIAVLQGIKQEALRILMNCGIGYIEPEVGGAFNEQFHEAIAGIPGDYDPNKHKVVVSSVMTLGYKHGKHILQSPQVVVCATPATEP